MNLRIPTLSILAGVGLLSACGGGGLDEDSTPAMPTVAQALAASTQVGKVGTFTEARNAVNSLLPLVGPPGTIPLPFKSGSTSKAVQPQGPMTKALVAAGQKAADPKAACSGGGSETTGQQNGVNVMSPYSNQLFNLALVTDANCRQVQQSGNDTYTITVNGLSSRNGEVPEGSQRISYAQRGESASAPFRIAEEYRYSEGGRNYTDTSLLETFGLTHRRNNSNNDIINGEFYTRTLGQLSGFDSGNAYGGALVLQQGASTTSRYLVTVLEAGALNVSGTLAVGLLSQPASLAANCGSGTFTVSTPTPLQLVDNGIQGKLQLVGSGGTATYLFSSDGQVEITAGDGSKQTVSQSTLGNCDVGG